MLALVVAGVMLDRDKTSKHITLTKNLFVLEKRSIFIAAPFLRYRKRGITVEASLVYAEKGLDEGLSSSGGDIFVDYYTPRSKEFDNFIGQGNRTRIIIGGVRVGYMVYPATNLKIELGLNVRSSENDYGQVNSTLLSIGLKTDIGNSYYDF